MGSDRMERSWCGPYLQLLAAGKPRAQSFQGHCDMSRELQKVNPSITSVLIVPA